MLMRNSASFVVALLLFLAFLSRAARPQPADPRNGQFEVVDGTAFDQGADGECEGVGQEEYCLMRRTLAAHTDYIYTQEKKP